MACNPSSPAQGELYRLDGLDNRHLSTSTTSIPSRASPVLYLPSISDARFLEDPEDADLRESVAKRPRLSVPEDVRSSAPSSSNNSILSLLNPRAQSPTVQYFPDNMIPDTKTSTAPNPRLPFMMHPIDNYYNANHPPSLSSSSSMLGDSSTMSSPPSSQPTSFDLGTRGPLPFSIVSIADAANAASAQHPHDFYNTQLNATSNTTSLSIPRRLSATLPATLPARNPSPVPEKDANAPHLQQSLSPRRPTQPLSPQPLSESPSAPLRPVPRRLNAAAAAVETSQYNNRSLALPQLLPYPTHIPQQQQQNHSQSSQYRTTQHPIPIAPLPASMHPQPAQPSLASISSTVMPSTSSGLGRSQTLSHMTSRGLAIDDEEEEEEEVEEVARGYVSPIRHSSPFSPSRSPPSSLPHRLSPPQSQSLSLPHLLPQGYPQVNGMLPGQLPPDIAAYGQPNMIAWLQSAATNSANTPHKVLKRKRTTREQSRALESAFMKDPLPSKRTKEVLARDLALSPNRVQVWFQNRRAKQKRQYMDQVGYSSLTGGFSHM